ncbi:transcription termination/antitermination protein NusG [Aureimonas ureilytica]|uniref:transcription termination/antitermination protein NusG n=1 Tax=Aureimonas ureilytica TaxID=401562 RepID=UPI00037A7BC0|nr:transcription termination/antitermination NusG family protein [Aureimonas ureilytica]
MEFTDQPSWFVVRCNPRCEERAVAGLLARKFHVHLPRGVKLIRRRHLRTKQAVSFPLLTSYAFVGLSTETPTFYDLRQVDGVHSVLGRAAQDPNDTRCRYLSVPASIIDEFKRLERAGKFSEVKPEVGKGPVIAGPRHFEPGDKVEILSGPLAGTTFVFDDYFGRNSARVMQELFGCLRPIVIGDVDCLAHAA